MVHFHPWIRIRNEEIGYWRRTIPCIECWNSVKRVHLISRHSIFLQRTTMNGIYEPLYPATRRTSRVHLSIRSSLSSVPASNFLRTVCRNQGADYAPFQGHALWTLYLSAASSFPRCFMWVPAVPGEIHRSHFSGGARPGFPDGGRSPSDSCYPLRSFHSREWLVTWIPFIRHSFRRSRDRY